jgi:hypothetical protein
MNENQMPRQWTERDIERLLLDPRTVGIGPFPPVIKNEMWIEANARQIEEVGAKVYLTKLLDVLREAFEGFGPTGPGEPRWTEANALANPEKCLMDPRAVGVGSFQPAVSEDRWIEANVDQIETMGAQRFLTTMLEVLRDNFGTAETARAVPKTARTVRPSPSRQTKQREGYRSQDRLGLYSHLLPALIKMQNHRKKLRVRDNGFLDSTIDQLSTAIVFDCRNLPLDFVADTGDAAFDEMQATRQPVRLPFDCCYFEFDQEIAIVTCMNDQHFYLDDGTKELAGNIVYFQTFRHWSAPSFVPDVEGDEGEFHDFTLENYKEFAAGMYFAEEDGPITEVPFLWTNRVGGDPALEAGARLLLGALTLLQDKLVISNQLKSDPRPWLTEHRRARGQPPKGGDVRVLTLNVPAIRNETKRTPIGTHESPALHWRRGHWRTLHRATEAETKTWIRKCLVGDPDRGYVAKNYRLAATMSPLLGSDRSGA